MRVSVVVRRALGCAKRSATSLIRSSGLRCMMLCLLASCGASQVRSQSGTPPPYSGVKYDLSGLSQVPHCVATATDWTTGVSALIITPPAVLVDLPLSFIVDTLFLPFEMRSDQGGWRPPPNQLCPPASE